jgi:hypothetical protein
MLAILKGQKNEFFGHIPTYSDLFGFKKRCRRQERLMLKTLEGGGLFGIINLLFSWFGSLALLQG